MRCGPRSSEAQSSPSGSERGWWQRSRGDGTNPRSRSNSSTVSRGLWAWCREDLVRCRFSTKRGSSSPLCWRVPKIPECATPPALPSRAPPSSTSGDRRERRNRRADRPPDRAQFPMDGDPRRARSEAPRGPPGAGLDWPRSRVPRDGVSKGVLRDAGDSRNLLSPAVGSTTRGFPSTFDPSRAKSCASASSGRSSATDSRRCGSIVAPRRRERTAK